MKKTIKFITLLLLIILFVVSLTGCSTTETATGKKTSTTKTGEQGSNIVENKEKNVQIEAIGLTENGDFAFKVTNNNSEPVYIESVNTIFKDANGNFAKKVESEIQFFTVDKNSEVVNYAWGFDEDFSKYSNYEFEVEFAENYMKKNFLTDNFEVVTNNTGKQIAVSVKNNNTVDVKTIEVIVAYYKNGNIVGCQLGYSDTTVGKEKTAYLNVEYPQDSKYNNVSFDTYTTYLLQASKY